MRCLRATTAVQRRRLFYRRVSAGVSARWQRHRSDDVKFRQSGQLRLLTVGLPGGDRINHGLCRVRCSWQHRKAQITVVEIIKCTPILPGRAAGKVLASNMALAACRGSSRRSAANA